MKNKEKKYPKVLIIGQSFNKKTGGGITLSNLFQGWPKDKIAVATQNIDYSQNSICVNYYQLGSEEKKWLFPLSLINKTNIYSGPVKLPQNYKESKKKLSTTTIKKGKKLIKIIKKFLEKSGLTNIFSYSHISLRFSKWVKEFAPDLVYTQLGSIGMNHFVSQLIEEIKIPYVIHFMDDWPIKFNREGLFSIFFRKKTDKELRHLIANASGLMTICQTMSDEYNLRYKRKSIPFHNPVDLDLWEKFSKHSWNVNKKFRVLFIGKLGKKSPALYELSHTIEKLKKSGMNIVFEIFTKDADSKEAETLRNYQGVLVNNSISHDKIPKLLSSFDVLFLPLSFEPSYVKSTRLSMPTKTSEYMISGTPVIVYAHPDTALNKYARSKKWAYVVSENNIDKLYEAIKKLYENKEMREKYGKKAIELAIKNHDSTLVRDRFRKALSSGVKNHKFHE